MKKLSIVIIILIALFLFAAADYYLNNLSPEAPLDLFKEEVVDEKPPTFIHSLFKLNEEIGGYKVASQVQTNQIFEKIDLSNIKNIKVYRNQLEKAEEEPIFLYEIHGPKDQGSLTYLSVKLQFIAQINATTETLNETGEFGHNSFFFNDKNYENTAFVFTQIGDNLFGFQYSKLDPQTYENVKAIIQILLSEYESLNLTS